MRGHRQGKNPARRKGHLDQVLPARGRLAKSRTSRFDAVRRCADLRRRLRTRESVPAKALLFLILTAARTGEVNGARWSEIDFETATWTVPAARMKARKEHKVPLSEPTLELLRSVYTEADNPFVFIGSRAGGTVRYRDGDDAAPDGAQRDHPRIPFQLPHLGGRAHQLSARGLRTSAGAHNWVRSRTRIRTHKFV